MNSETPLQRARRTKRFGYLLSVDSDPKTAKSNKANGGEYLTAIQYLAPAMSGGGKDLCPFRSPGCTAACLNTAGNKMYLEGKLRARFERTQLYLKDREAYLALLVHEIEKFVRKCEKLGKKPAIRLNGTSDIVWEKVAPVLFDMFPNVQFYDYTKIPRRNPPANYDLTFSRSEENDFNCGLAHSRGMRVAVVFDKKYDKGMPTTWFGVRVENGDLHDMTFKRPAACVLGLYAKGEARKDDTGFVILT